MISPERRRETLDGLRRGTVPERGLDQLAVGLDGFQATLDDELEAVARGGAGFKAVRGDYGCGKTFFARWLQERARQRGFATAEVQISETETPLHRLETVYRRALERLATASVGRGALGSILDGWLFALEQDVLAEDPEGGADEDLLVRRSAELLESRLAGVARTAPAFATALRAYHRARAEERPEIAEGLLAWIGGQPQVGARAKTYAGLRGQVDHFGALGFLEGLLVVLRDSGDQGLVLVLDEVETLQRVRSDVRDKGLNALRQWIDEVDSGRFPGLYLVITGTPAFFDGPQGVRRLEPLAQRLHVEWDLNPRFDNPRAVQLRLRPFDGPRLEEVGRRVRDLYAEHSEGGERIRSRVGDEVVGAFAARVAGRLGGKVGVAPRIFLKKLMELLDRVDQFEDFDPVADGRLRIGEAELNAVERAAVGPDDVELDP